MMPFVNWTKRIQHALEAEPRFSELIRGITADAHQLIAQQWRLFRREVQVELRELKTAALFLGTGMLIAAAGALFLLLSLVHLVNALTFLPLWGCYALVGGAILVLGVTLIGSGRRKSKEISLSAPPHTVESLKENWRWLTIHTIPERR